MGIRIIFSAYPTSVVDPDPDTNWILYSKTFVDLGPYSGSSQL